MPKDVIAGDTLHAKLKLVSDSQLGTCAEVSVVFQVIATHNEPPKPKPEETEAPEVLADAERDLYIKWLAK